MLDQKFYEEENRLLRQLAKHWEEMYNNLLKEHEELVKEYEENRLLRQLAKHWEEMYNNLLKEHEELVKEYDNLVMETVERDLKC